VLGPVEARIREPARAGHPVIGQRRPRIGRRADVEVPPDRGPEAVEVVDRPAEEVVVRRERSALLALQPGEVDADAGGLSRIGARGPEHRGRGHVADDARPEGILTAHAAGRDRLARHRRDVPRLDPRGAGGRRAGRGLDPAGRGRGPRRRRCARGRRPVRRQPPTDRRRSRPGRSGPPARGPASRVASRSSPPRPRRRRTRPAARSGSSFAAWMAPTGSPSSARRPSARRAASPSRTSCSPRRACASCRSPRWQRRSTRCGSSTSTATGPMSSSVRDRSRRSATSATPWRRSSTAGPEAGSRSP
jgi:hypothetical protein